MSRNFANVLPDYTSGVSNKANVWRSHLAESIDYVLKTESHFASNSSIYTGRGGIAYSLWHVLRVPEARATLQASSLYSTAVSLAESAVAHIQSSHRDSHRWSIMFGESGCSAVAALCSHAAAHLHPENDSAKAQLEAMTEKHVSNYCHLGSILASNQWCEDEILYGRAGYLTGCLLLNRHIHPKAVPSTILESVALALLKSGHEQAQANPQCGSPLWWEWHDSAYLGVAHGSMGTYLFNHTHLFVTYQIHVFILEDPSQPTSLPPLSF